MKNYSKLPKSLLDLKKQVDSWIKGLHYSISYRMIVISLRKQFIGERFLKKYFESQPYDGFHIALISKKTLIENDWNLIFKELYESSKKYLNTNISDNLNKIYDNTGKIKEISKILSEQHNVKLIFYLDCINVNPVIVDHFRHLIDSASGHIILVLKINEWNKIKEKYPATSSSSDKLIRLDNFLSEDDLKNIDNIINLFITKELSDDSKLKIKHFIYDNIKNIDTRIIDKKIYEIVVEEMP